jgi:hypothetical protein
VLKYRRELQTTILARRYALLVRFVQEKLAGGIEVDQNGMAATNMSIEILPVRPTAHDLNQHAMG